MGIVGRKVGPEEEVTQLQVRFVVLCSFHKSQFRISLAFSYKIFIHTKRVGQ